MANARKVIDAETGEILIAGPSDEYTLRSKKQDRAYSEMREFRGRQRSFTWSAMDELHEVSNVLSTAQCGFLMLLQCYVGYNDGVLVNPDKEPMEKCDMMMCLKLKRSKRSTFYDFYNACLLHGILIENEDGTHSVNDRYHFRGALDDRNAVKMYSTRIKELYSENKATDIGLIYKMLPYVHYESNALCANPSEPDPLKIVWLSREGLAKVVGISVGELSRRMPQMELDGMSVIATTRASKSLKYTLNPLLFYRKSAEPDSHTLAVFSKLSGEA